MKEKEKHVKTLVGLRSDLKDKMQVIAHRRNEQKQPNDTLKAVLNELINEGLKTITK